jgi:GTP-binding protein HflX
MSRLGGGIGTRGPGETQLETDRRRISRRVKTIRGQLESVRRTRQIQRSQRQGVPLATVAMVGYTNAGKSTLFNRLTGAGVTADARMFATLDPTARVAQLPSRRRVVLSDTVGFIRNLPTTLVQAFRATLEEVRQATLLLHVLDASSPSAAEYSTHVSRVLEEIDAAEIPQLLVWNKTDLIPQTEAGALEQRLPPEASPASDGDHHRRTVSVSAKTGDGIELLLAAIDDMLPLDPVCRAVFRFPADAGGAIHLLHENARVLRREYVEEQCIVEADTPESIVQRLSSYLETE